MINAATNGYEKKVLSGKDIIASAERPNCFYTKCIGYFDPFGARCHEFASPPLRPSRRGEYLFYLAITLGK